MIRRIGELPLGAARPVSTEKELYFEVGFGDGRFWPAFVADLPAAARPHCLGVEISPPSLLKAARRLREAGLQDEVTLCRAEASVVLREAVAPRSLSGIVVNFPDPWPKESHTDHRLLSRDFFALAADRLKDGAPLIFTTDHEEYFGWALDQARQTGLFGISTGDAPPPAALQTKYALKWRDLGLAPMHARFVALPQPPARPAHGWLASALLEEDSLPHALVQLPPDLDLFALFAEKQSHQFAGHTVILLDVQRSARRPVHSVQAHVVDDGFEQDVLIDLTLRDDGRTLVRLSRFAAPVVTSGVKRAVGLVTDALERAGADVLHRAH